METVLTIIGSIASVGSAVWAFVSAKRSSTFAQKAKDIRDDLIDRRKLVEISQVYQETKKILSIVGEVGPTCTETSVKTVDVPGIARQVDEYSRFLNEQTSHFTEMFDNRAKDLCTNLRPEIEKLAEAVEINEVREAGKAIYYQIYDFMPVTKDLTDKRKEK